MTHNVLLVLDGLVHPTLHSRLWLELGLRALPGYQFRRARSLESLAKVSPARFDALVLYYHHKTLSAPALEAFEAYVRSGGGVVAIHSASASFKSEPRYFAILGGRFVKHGPIEEFELRPTHGDPHGSGAGSDCDPGPCMEGIPPFTIRDELYRHEYDPRVTVHLNTGDGEPFAWSHNVGAGRVFYLAAGHTFSAVANPHIKEILRRGLAWACGARR